MKDLLGLAQQKPKKFARKKYERKTKGSTSEQKIDARRFNTLTDLCTTQFGFVIDDNFSVAINKSKQIEKPYTYRKACDHVDQQEPKEDKNPLASKQDRLNAIKNSIRREFARRLKDRFSKDAIKVKWGNFLEKFSPQEHSWTRLHITPP